MKTDIPKNIVEAIEIAWPDRVVDMPVDAEESYFADVYPKLKSKLARIPGASLVYEREADPELHWSEGSDPDEDPPDWSDDSLSYHVFFLSPDGKQFRYETETDEPDEGDVLQRFKGQGTMGRVVGVSLVAPFAIITSGAQEAFENGSYSNPDIEPQVFSFEGEALDPDELYGEQVDEGARKILDRLRDKIVRILESQGIATLSEEVLRRPVPWLRAGKEAFLGAAGEHLTVRDAFFFRGP